MKNTATPTKQDLGASYMRGDYRQNKVWNFVMLFANAVFNVLTGVFDRFELCLCRSV